MAGDNGIDYVEALHPMPRAGFGHLRNPWLLTSTINSDEDIVATWFEHHRNEPLTPIAVSEAIRAITASQ